MRTVHFLITLGWLVLCPCFSTAQIAFCEPTTFTNGNLGSWVLEANAAVTTDGTAAAQDPTYWADRGPIQSPSGGGAVVLFSDIGFLRATDLDFSGQPQVVLSFNQYYREYLSTSVVEISGPGGVIATIFVNDNLVNNVETSPADLFVLDISAFVANRDNITIEFRLEGPAYFWIIDDITFCDQAPYPVTVPNNTFGEFLAQQGYPFGVEPNNNIESNGATAYVPDQLVVQFVPGVSEPEKQALRDTLGAVKIDDCVCGTLELWEIDGSAFFDEQGQSPAGGSIDVLTNKDGTAEKPIIQNVDPNYYNGVILNAVPPLMIDTIPADSLVNLLPADPQAFRIAIIDSGMDYQHPDIRDFVRRKPDTDCPDYANDPVGWNFVDDNNNPYDDNSHGTHVAGIIADTLRKYQPVCTYQLIPYKAHDRNGVSTLFRVSCATYQAIADDADIINDSWGFYGNSSTVLRAAMDAAVRADILIVSAAGNDSLFLDTLLQYPACYAYTGIRDSLICVGATDSLVGSTGLLQLDKAVFSNFSRTYVDIMAPGRDIVSAVPRWRGVNRDTLSGTSMATPMVTAAAALAYCCNNADGDPDNNTVWAAKDTVLLSWAIPTDQLLPYANGGNFLSYQPRDSCLVGVNNTLDILFAAPAYQIYPNPAADELNIRSLAERAPAVVRLLTASGQVVGQWRSYAWHPEEVQTMSLRGLAPGIYFLQVQGEAYLWTGKMVKI